MQFGTWIKPPWIPIVELDSGSIRADCNGPVRSRIALIATNSALCDYSPSGRLNATNASPAFVCSLPAPPAAMTTY